MPTLQLSESDLRTDPGANDERRAYSASAPSGSRRNELLLVLPFLLLFLVQLAHHQLWQDELNAWGIAVASPNLPRLFHLIHYEAHPSLWYLLLWPLARFTASPLAMKAVEAAIGMAVYLVLALRSPFSRREKVLLYLSYFICFEYTVLSRMYGVLLLLTTLYADQRTARPQRVLTLALLLALMANTDTMGILLSSALMIEYLLRHHRQADGVRIAGRRLAAAMVLYLAAAALSIATLRPARDIKPTDVGHMFQFAGDPAHFAHALLNVFVLPWFPISFHFPHAFWEPSASAHPLAYGLLLPAMAGLLYAAFRKDRPSLLALGAAIGFLLAFEHLIYIGFVRHHGVVFLAFLVALWMQRCRRGRISAPAYVLLGLSAVGGVLAEAGQWMHPFSNAGAMAGYIRTHGLEQEPLIGTLAFSAGAVAEELAKPIYFLDCHCIDTFVQYDNRTAGYDLGQIPDRLPRAMRELGAPQALLVLTVPLDRREIQEIEQRGIRLSPLAEFSGAEAPFDPTALYQATRLGATEHALAERNNLASEEKPVAHVPVTRFRHP